MLKGRNVVKAVVCLLLAFMFFGCCASGGVFSGNYRQIAPTKYPKTEKVMVFLYPDADIDQIYELLYNDYLIIGKSIYIERYKENLEKSPKLIDHAMSIGADLVIATAHLKQQKAEIVTDEDDNEKLVVVDMYEHTVVYLRNINRIVPIWEKKKSDYVKTAQNALEGMWYNEESRIEVYQSGEQLAGFWASEQKTDNKYDLAGYGGKGLNGAKDEWVRGDLVMVFAINTKSGLYIRKNGAPVPSEYSLNKFGHLSVRFKNSKEVISFARGK